MTLSSLRTHQHEAFLLCAQLANFAVGVALARMGHPIAATLVLGFAHTTGGWLAHDYIHGRCAARCGYLGPLTSALVVQVFTLKVARQMLICFGIAALICGLVVAGVDIKATRICSCLSVAAGM
jgi:hypothetical protein